MFTLVLHLRESNMSTAALSWKTSEPTLVKCSLRQGLCSDTRAIFCVMNNIQILHFCLLASGLASAEGKKSSVREKRVATQT